MESIVLTVIMAAVAGAFLWSIMEYTLHRFLGHDRRTMPNFFSVEHSRHHREGNYFAPARKKAGAALVVTLAVLPLAVMVAGWVGGAVFTAAFVIMYGTYEFIHHRAHTHPGFGPYGRFVRRHHFYHHFGNPQSNHGVTSPIWDLVFGTLEKPARIRVPARMAMPWLVDADGQVRPEFRDHYEIATRR